MLRRPGATRTRKRNCLGINVFLLFLAGNERENRKQKLRGAPAAFAPRPPPRRRALQGARVPAARPQRARAPRASRLAPRATSPPRAWRAAELAAGRRGPGCGRRISAALVSAVRCALHAGSALEGLLSSPRTQAAAGRRGSELPPGRRRSHAPRLVGAPRWGIPGFPQGAWGASGPPRRNPARWWRGASRVGRPGRRSLPGRDGTGAPWSRCAPARGPAPRPPPRALPGRLGLLALGGEGAAWSPSASRPPGRSPTPRGLAGRLRARARGCPENSGYSGLPRRVIG